MKTAAAYIRVSTDDQIEYSPESQIKLIKEFATKNGYVLTNDLIFQDDGISGKFAKKRPDFNKMIAQSKLKPAPFDAILVWKFSRFARNQEESIFYKSMLKKNGIEVISISEPLPEGPFGELVERIIEWCDEYYSIRLSGEVRRGMTEKVSRGEAVSVPAFGYDIVDKEYVINPDEADIVRKIFDNFANGANYRELTIYVNSLGVKSHRGNKFETRTIEYILNNPVYLGKIRWNPTGRTKRNFNDPNVVITDGHHEPIITKEQWDKAQEQITKIKSMYKKSAKPFNFANILQGIVRCSDCGGTLIKAGKYLQCQRYTKALCTHSHSTGYEKMLQAIINHIEDDFKTRKFKITNKTTETESENSFIREQIKKEEKKLLRVKEAFESGIDSIEEYKQNKTRILQAIEVLEKKITKTTLSTDELRKKFIEKNKDAVKQLRSTDTSDEEKNKILRSMVEKVVYDKKKEEIVFFYYL